MAALTTLFLYYSVVFVHHGTVWILNTGVLLELLFAFVFLLALLWSHGIISNFFASPKVSHISGNYKSLLEGLTVIASSLLICYVVYFLPYTIYYRYMGMHLEILPERVRLAYVISSITSLFFYYFVERQRNVKELQAEHLRAEQLHKENFRAQLESLKNQVNPHFLFNSLNVLHSLIYVDSDKAATFLSQLAEVYRSLLQTSDKQLVPLQQEMSLVNSYIYLLQTRFGDNVQFMVDVPDTCLQLQLPPTSLQMLLENAIKHNGSTTQKPLHIQITANHETIVVTNNLQPRLEETASNKVGLQNIISRYSYLTDKQVIVEKTESDFTVKLPLLHPEQHENSDH